MNFIIRVTRPCRAELIRLFGALAETDIAFAEAAHAALQSGLQQISAGEGVAQAVTPGHPELHQATLDLHGMQITLVYAQESSEVLTLLAVQA